jgi:hypothetical protein
MAAKRYYAGVLAMGILLSGGGCTYLVPLPQIAHHHWQRNTCGADLFNDDGKETASWCHASDVQACVFDHRACEYFDTDDKALAYIKRTTEKAQ